MLDFEVKWIGNLLKHPQVIQTCFFRDIVQAAQEAAQEAQEGGTDGEDAGGTSGSEVEGSSDEDDSSGLAEEEDSDSSNEPNHQPLRGCCAGCAGRPTQPTVLKLMGKVSELCCSNKPRTIKGQQTVGGVPFFIKDVAANKEKCMQQLNFELDEPPRWRFASAGRCKEWGPAGACLVCMGTAHNRMALHEAGRRQASQRRQMGTRVKRSAADSFRTASHIAPHTCRPNRFGQEGADAALAVCAADLGLWDGLSAPEPGEDKTPPPKLQVSKAGRTLLPIWRSLMDGVHAVWWIAHRNGWQTHCPTINRRSGRKHAKQQACATMSQRLAVIV